MLAHQGGQTVGAAAEVHRFGRYQNPHSRRNGDHVAALTARSIVVRTTASMLAGIRTVTAPITISTIGVLLGPASAIDACE
ncbi:MAG: hypothetical protein WCE35_06590 [Bradyrhizobium sp.]